MAQRTLPGLNQGLARLACKADDGLTLSGRHMHGIALEHITCGEMTYHELCVVSGILNMTSQPSSSIFGTRQYTQRNG